MAQAFNNILIKAAKSKKHVSITLDLYDFLIIPSKQLNDKLSGARGHVKGFSTLIQLFSLKDDLTNFPRIYLCILISAVYSLIS